MSELDQVKEETRRNKEQRLKTLQKSNEVLGVKISCLELLKKHYEEYWLDIHLKYIGSSLEARLSRESFIVYDTIMDKIEDRSQKIEKEMSTLDTRIAEVQDRLGLYRRHLNPSLLEEYERLKEELECQDILIQWSKTIDEQSGDDIPIFSDTMSDFV